MLPGEPRKPLHGRSIPSYSVKELLPWKASSPLQVTSNPQLQPEPKCSLFQCLSTAFIAKRILPAAPEGKHLGQGEQQALVGIWGICRVWAPEQKEGKRNECFVDVSSAWLCQRSTNPLEWLLAAGRAGGLFWGQAGGSNCLHTRDHC